MRIGTLQFIQSCQKQNKGDVRDQGAVHDRTVTKKLKWFTWITHSVTKDYKVSRLNDIAKNK